MHRLSTLPLLACGLASCTRPAPTATRDAAAEPVSSSPSPDASTPRAEVDADAPQAPWNVVLVSIDSMRADMPWAGYPRAIAPRLEALYARSVAFTRAYATSSFTSKSLAGVLTGRYPSELTRTGSFFTRYLAPTEFFCTSLADAHIPCVGAHAHAYFAKGQAGFDHGFSAWKIVPGITFDYQTDPYVTSDKLTPLAIATLDDVARASRPFFAWFHYMDPHDEYKPHDDGPRFGTRPRDRYDEEVFFTDAWIGRLFDWIDGQPWAQRTAIVVTADHGEAFGEHGMTRHAHEVWEELVHVPLFVHLPGVAPRTIDTPRSHLDLAPTILELLGAPHVEGLQGTSLVPELRGGDAPARDVVVDLPEDEYNERRRALVHGTTKIIAFGNDARFALYDLATDPREADDRIRKDPELAAEMKQRYRDASRRIHDVAPRGGIPKHDGR